MMNSPLQLERYYLTAVHLDCNDRLQAKETPQIQVESTVGLAVHGEDARRWKVILTVNFKPLTESEAPYKGSASFTGFFAVVPEYPTEKVPMLVETNAPSVLYAAIRELLCNLTARGPMPMVTLPTQSFYRTASKPEPAKNLSPQQA